MNIENKEIVSIIIPTWNQRGLLGECLTSILNAKDNFKREIIVVDDASDDDTVAHVKNNFPDVKLIENSVNRGYARSVNRGVEASQGNLIFLLNNDTVLYEDSIGKLLKCLLSNDGIGAAAPETDP
jgi:GT2 family glycosyltransferase